MDNLWILTEERPKEDVIRTVLHTYCSDFCDSIVYEENVKIMPVMNNGRFTFMYMVFGVKLKGINNIYLKVMKGNSSLVDFLVFRQKNEPDPNMDYNNNLLMAIEETKTKDSESRNTAVYQRGTKFVYIRQFYKDVKLYMIYSGNGHDREKTHSDTNIFGTRMLLTLGVTIIGDTISKHLTPFKNYQELIEFKSNMRKPPKGNVQIEIIPFPDCIKISGRLAKPGIESSKYIGNIGHDPNIGALSLISACIRRLGWNKDIIITQHQVYRSFVLKYNTNKFLYICRFLNIKLEGIDLCDKTNPLKYWDYEFSSEKITSIFLHIVALSKDYMFDVYDNHAGCERGYFRDKYNRTYAVKKVDKNRKKISIPDLVLYNKDDDIIFLIEGKKFDTLEKGLEELDNYDLFEKNYISEYYPGAKIYRYLSIFGANQKNHIHDKVLIYINKSGEIYINQNAPKSILSIFDDLI